MEKPCMEARAGKSAEWDMGWCGIWWWWCGEKLGRLPMWAAVGVMADETESGKLAIGMGMVGPPNGMLANEVKAWRGWLVGDDCEFCEEAGGGLFVPKLNSESDVSLRAGDRGGELSCPSSVSVDSGLFPEWPKWCNLEYRKKKWINFIQFGNKLWGLIRVWTRFQILYE